MARYVRDGQIFEADEASEADLKRQGFEPATQADIDRHNKQAEYNAKDFRGKLVETEQAAIEGLMQGGRELGKLRLDDSGMASALFPDQAPAVSGAIQKHQATRDKLLADPGVAERAERHPIAHTIGVDAPALFISGGVVGKGASLLARGGAMALESAAVGPLEESVSSTAEGRDFDVENAAAIAAQDLVFSGLAAAATKVASRVGNLLMFGAGNTTAKNVKRGLDESAGPVVPDDVRFDGPLLEAETRSRRTAAAASPGMPPGPERDEMLRRAAPDLNEKVTREGGDVADSALDTARKTASVNEEAIGRRIDEMLPETTPAQTAWSAKATERLDKARNTLALAADEPAAAPFVARATEVAEDTIRSIDGSPDASTWFRASAKASEQLGLIADDLAEASLPAGSVVEKAIGDLRKYINKNLTDRTLFGQAAEMHASLRGPIADKIEAASRVSGGSLGKRLADFVAAPASARAKLRMPLEQAAEGLEELAQAHERFGTALPKQIEDLKERASKLRRGMALADDVQAAIKNKPVEAEFVPDEVADTVIGAVEDEAKRSGKDIVTDKLAEIVAEKLSATLAATGAGIGGSVAGGLGAMAGGAIGRELGKRYGKAAARQILESAGKIARKYGSEIAGTALLSASLLDDSEDGYAMGAGVAGLGFLFPRGMLKSKSDAFKRMARVVAPIPAEKLDINMLTRIAELARKDLPNDADYGEFMGVLTDHFDNPKASFKQADGGVDYLAKQTGTAGGATRGGRFVGSDGVERYVKFMPELKAKNEVANAAAYEAFGIPSVKLEIVPVSSKAGDYATEGGRSQMVMSEMLPQEWKALDKFGSEAGKVTPEMAREYVQGVPADIVMGNWDVSNNAANIMTNGKGVVRIDVGEAGPNSTKFDMKNEWQSLEKGFQPAPGWADHLPEDLPRQAGIDAIKSVKTELVSGVEKIESAMSEAGGSFGFVQKIWPHLTPKRMQALAKQIDTRLEFVKKNIDKIATVTFLGLAAGSDDENMSAALAAAAGMGALVGKGKLMGDAVDPRQLGTIPPKGKAKRPDGPIAAKPERDATPTKFYPNSNQARNEYGENMRPYREAQRADNTRMAQLAKDYGLGAAAIAAGGGTLALAGDANAAEPEDRIVAAERILAIDQAATQRIKHTARVLAGLAEPPSPEGLTTHLARFGAEHEDPRAAFHERKAILAKSEISPALVYDVLGSSLGDVASVSPELYQAATARILDNFRYLRENLPPEVKTSMLHPTGMPISESSMRDWATQWSTAMDPESVLDDIERGTVTHLQIETLRNAHPDIYQSMRTEIIEEVGANFASIPTSTKMQLDILFQADGLAGPMFSSEAAAIIGAAGKAASQRKQAGPAATGADDQDAAASSNGLEAIRSSVTNRSA
jgi:hypothetical protein